MKIMKPPAALTLLREDVIRCRRCPRLVAFREGVAPKAPFLDQTYWHKPVPGFGDPNAWLLIIGLAPAAHGGNRTGRIFTGDLTARFLMAALHQQGFANQPTSTSADDGLQLKGCYLTAAIKCVPPQNKPSAEECKNCSEYLQRELAILCSVDSVLALGRLAFDAYLDCVRKNGAVIKRPRFQHGGIYPIPGFPTLYASYHPSPRNTNTGTLTAGMFKKYSPPYKRGMMIKTSKNIYDQAEPSDGKRILVMRLWPRGQSKEKLQIKAWLKELGTEPALIKQWKTDKIDWKTLAQEYRKSLKGKEELLKELAQEAKKGTLTLLCSCKDEKHCHRTLLKEAIEKY